MNWRCGCKIRKVIKLFVWTANSSLTYNLIYLLQLGLIKVAVILLNEENIVR